MTDSPEDQEKSQESLEKLFASLTTGKKRRRPEPDETLLAEYRAAVDHSLEGLGLLER